MRLRGMVVGGLRRRHEVRQPVCGEDVVEPAPRLAGRDADQRPRPCRQPLERRPRAGIERRDAVLPPPPLHEARAVVRDQRLDLFRREVRGEPRHRLRAARARPPRARSPARARAGPPRRRRSSWRRGCGAGCRRACRPRRRPRDRGRSWRAGVQGGDGRGEILAEERKGPRGGRLRPADQHVVPLRPPEARDHGPGRRPAAAAWRGCARRRCRPSSSRCSPRGPPTALRPRHGAGPAPSCRHATAAAHGRRRGSRRGG